MLDKKNIDDIVKTFFSIFTNTAKKQPDWNTIHNICISQAIIIKKEGTTEEIYTLNTFIEPRKKILSDGTLTDFEEMEAAEETKITGSIAQRSSAYKKSGYLHGKYFAGKGNKFFQFIKTTDGWKINSVIWEDE